LDLEFKILILAAAIGDKLQNVWCRPLARTAGIVIGVLATAPIAAFKIACRVNRSGKRRSGMRSSRTYATAARTTQRLAEAEWQPWGKRDLEDAVHTARAIRSVL
jgi:hypothetical protein